MTKVTQSYAANDQNPSGRSLPKVIEEGTTDAIQAMLQYDSDGLGTTILRRNGTYITRHEYDEAGSLIRTKVTGKDVETEDLYGYDAQGRLIRHRATQDQDALKIVEQRYEYDLVGRVIAEETWEGEGSPTKQLERTTMTTLLPSRTIIKTLPASGVITATLDGLGRVQQNVIDPKSPGFMEELKTITTRTRYDAHDNVVFRGGEHDASATRYDAAHRPVESITSDGTRTSTTIDAAGRMTKFENVTDGTKVTNDYTPGGKLKATGTNRAEIQFEWDGAGRTRKSVAKPADGQSSAISEVRYDEAGRLLEQSFGEGLETTMTRTFDGATWSYGGSDQATTVTSHENDGLNQYPVTLMQDAFSRATSVEFPNAPDMTVEQDYDVAGNVTRAKTPEMPGQKTYEYEGRGLMTEERLPEEGNNRFSYTADGVLEQYTDPTEEKTRTESDGLGRPFRRSYEDGSTEEIHYDQLRVWKVKDRQDRWQYFKYDEKGRLRKVTNDEGIVLDELTYDDESENKNRLTVWRTPESRLELAQFDAEGRPQLTIQTRYGKDGVALDEYRQSHTYDDFGRRKSWTMPGTLPQGWTTAVYPRYDGRQPHEARARHQRPGSGHAPDQRVPHERTSERAQAGGELGRRESGGNQP